MFIKYMGFFLIWPGIQATKVIALLLFVFPFLVFWAVHKERFNKDDFLEAGYWIFLALASVMTLAMASHIDPRYFRYNIAISAYAAVVGLYVFLKHGVGIKNGLVGGLIVLLLSVPGYRIMFSQEGYFERPTYKENMQVLFNQISTDYIVKKEYPAALKIQKIINENPDKKDSIAYYSSINDVSFFVPTKRIVDVFRSSLLHWDDFSTKEQLLKKLQAEGIRWIISTDHGAQDSVGLINIESFSEILLDRYKVNLEREKIVTSYGFPEELQ